MKLGYIYVLIGISTLALNIILTLHIIKKHVYSKYRETWENDDVVTFSLAGREASEAATTSAISYDDTLPLE